MQNKVIGFCNRTKQFIKNHNGKLLAVAVLLMSSTNSHAAEFDPATLITAASGHFQTAIAGGAIVFIALLGVRMVRRGFSIAR
jgi:hypothetical protein